MSKSLTKAMLSAVTKAATAWQSATDEARHALALLGSAILNAEGRDGSAEAQASIRDAVKAGLRTKTDANVQRVMSDARKAGRIYDATVQRDDDGNPIPGTSAIDHPAWSDSCIREFSGITDPGDIRDVWGEATETYEADDGMTLPKAIADANPSERKSRGEPKPEGFDRVAELREALAKAMRTEPTKGDGVSIDTFAIAVELADTVGKLTAPNVHRAAPKGTRGKGSASAAFVGTLRDRADRVARIARTVEDTYRAAASLKPQEREPIA